MSKKKNNCFFFLNCRTIDRFLLKTYKRCDFRYLPTISLDFFTAIIICFKITAHNFEQIM